MKLQEQGIKVFRQIISNLKPFAFHAVLMALIFMEDRLVLFRPISSLNLNGWLFEVYHVILYTFFLLGVLLLIGKYSKALSIAFFSFFYLINSVQWFVRVKFNFIMLGHWVGIVNGTSFSEIKMFLSEYLTLSSMILGVIWILLFVAIVYVLLKVNLPGWTFHGIVLGMLLTLPFVVAGLFWGSRGELMSVMFVEKSISALKECRQLGQIMRHPHIPVNSHIRANQCPVVVFVIGESSSRSHWQLYGYKERDTNPKLNDLRDELYVYSNLVASAGNTAAVMRFLMTEATLDSKKNYQCNLSQVAKKVGFCGAYLTAQPHFSVFDGDDDFLFSDCETKVWIQDGVKEGIRYDDVLVEQLKRFLHSVNTPKVAFLHTNGSHNDYMSFYPHERAKFGFDDIDVYSRRRDPVNKILHYDNTIAFTDEILFTIIQELKNMSSPAILIYVSDHGESPSSDKWRDYMGMDVWEIPMVIWMSDEYKKTFPDNVVAVKRSQNLPLQNDQLFAGIVQLMGIDGYSDSKPEENFLSEKFVPRKQRLIRDGTAVYPKDTKEPSRM